MAKRYFVVFFGVLVTVNQVFAQGFFYVPPVIAPPRLVNVPELNVPGLPGTPELNVPGLLVPNLNVPSLPMPPSVMPPSLPTPSPTPIPTIPSLPPVSIPPISNPTPTPTPTPPIVVVLPVPSASAFLSIWTDGFVTPITSGVRNIGAGDNVTKLKWSSLNAITCQGSNLETNSLTEGEILDGSADLVIPPGADVTYAVRCKNTENIWSVWKSVKITKDNLPPLVNNLPPVTPIIRGADISTGALVNASVIQVVPFTFKSDDPDGDDVSYVVDWNNDGVGESQLPGNGFVLSGTALGTTNTWPGVGTFTFKVRAIDNKGNVSSWAEHTINITATTIVTVPLVAPVINLTTNKTLVRAGDFANITLSILANYPVECDIYGLENVTTNLSHGGAASQVDYFYRTSNLNASQEVKVECQPNAPSQAFPQEVRTVRIDVVPQFQEI